MSSLAPGRRVGRYVIRQRLGAGGMGIVYLAFDEQLERQVALKVIAPGLAAETDFQKRFTGEARAAAAVDHPHLLPIFETGDDDGRLYLAMRYVPGFDLGTLIARDGPLPLERAVHILGQVASALDAAHRADLVHRDVKPGNVLLGPDDHAYLADFGLATAASAASRRTRPGQLAAGSADYLAPELVEGRPADARSDVYALACLAFASLVGQPPFRRDDEVATLYAHVHEPPPPPTRLRPDLPPAVEEVLARGLAKAPELRFPSAGEFAAALAEAAGAGSAARPDGVTRARSLTRVPVRAITLIGRDADLRIVEDLLHAGARLVTLTGPGGIGKTSLCRAVVERLQAGVNGPVAVIELESVRSPDLVPTTVAAALGGDGDAAAQVGRGDALIALDNLEHLVGAATWIASWLDACPRLQVVATSREALRIGVEHVHPVGPLDTDASRELFLARARRFRPDLAGGAAIDAVCARLDRLPLAIELAAARTSILSPDALLARLDRALDSLGEGPRDRSDRKRTLRSTIAWSYDLLEPQLQGVFRRLAVFNGGFDAEAAETVTGASLDDLDKLLAGSLLTGRYESDEPRFHLLETIRAYAFERLAEDAAARDAAERIHAEWAVAFVERWATHHRDEQAVRALARELDNLRAAMAWAAAAEADEQRLRIAVGLHDVWHTRAIAEGRSWIEPGLETVAIPEGLRLDALYEVSALAFRQGKLDDARRLSEATLLLARKLNQPGRVVAALVMLATIGLASGAPDEAQKRREEALAIATHHDDRRPLLVALAGQANADLLAGRPDLAAAAFEECLAIARAVARPESLATACFNVGLAKALDGRDLAAARTALREALDRYSELDDLEGIGYVLVVVASLLVEVDPAASAVALGASRAALSAADATLEVVEARLRDEVAARVRDSIGAEAVDEAAKVAAAEPSAAWIETARAALSPSTG